MPYGINEQSINKLKVLFAAINEIDEVILYGSRAKGGYKESSDIDITLKGIDLNLAVINKLSIQIDDLLLPYTFDISIYDHLNNKDLIDHINRAGKTIYTKQHKLL